MNNQQKQLDEEMNKCWQAVSILNAMMRSPLEEMEGVDIAIALKGVHSLLHPALCEMHYVLFEQQEQKND